MHFRAVVLSLCGVMAAGLVTAAPAAANPVGCTEQLVADLQGAPVPDPSTIVTVEGLNVRIDRTGIDAFSSHLTAAALRFAECATPNPFEILPCIQAVERAIVDDITGPMGDDELYLRYVYVYPEGASLNGEYAVADALAIAGCLT